MASELNLEELVEQRNALLLKFFTLHGLVVRITGSTQNPIVILNDKIVLSCFVKNFDLIFSKSPSGKEIFRIFKLNEEYVLDKSELIKTIDQCAHRPAYKIKLSDYDLFLSGFNFINSEESLGKFPVFAKYNPKIYYNRKYADEIVQNLLLDKYSVIVV